MGGFLHHDIDLFHAIAGDISVFQTALHKDG